ncbi:RadC family protein [Defluviicoccus vanus]|uniref:RadC family protein n=1 Tax=Defluviicoccus vanus TaxID=111831 RepID=UPI001CBA5FD6|nr:DNA repair protein RadC [Defluviicoccus vanus]
MTGRPIRVDSPGGDEAAEPPQPAEPSTGQPGHADHRRRLRQRFLNGDADALADYELLELLLFYAVDRVDVKPLARALLAEFGSFSAVLAGDAARLLRHKRVNDRTLALFRAIREAGRRILLEQIADRPVLSSSTALMDYCRLRLADESIEHFRVLFLDRKNKLIADEEQQRGTVDHAPIYPREVIKRALELGATALILVHNHPSGDPSPSAADVAMTREVNGVAQRLGITLHDHVIVAKGGTRSLRALGLL